MRHQPLSEKYEFNSNYYHRHFEGSCLRNLLVFLKSQRSMKQSLENKSIIRLVRSSQRPRMCYRYFEKIEKSVGFFSRDFSFVPHTKRRGLHHLIISSHKSFQDGFKEFIKFSFLCLFHFFTCFSLAMASSIVLWNS